jgi:RimJ/RimL family protein N-acetyltransferase
MSIVIKPFDSSYTQDLLNLVKRIQVDEFNIPIVESQNQELYTIQATFQKDNGNYWIALFNGQLMGTIAVLDIGHQAVELRDVFLDKEFRGKGFAIQLLDTVYNWCHTRNITKIFLGTTLAFKAAHRFYEKNGFKELKKEEMPSFCKPMDCDEKFYFRDLT